MARVILPDNAPITGELIDVVGGMADGQLVPFTGSTLQYVKTRPGGYEGDPNEGVDLSQVRELHHYEMREIEHKLTGEKRWVYWCLDDPSI